MEKLDIFAYCQQMRIFGPRSLITCSVLIILRLKFILLYPYPPKSLIPIGCLKKLRIPYIQHLKRTSNHTHHHQKLSTTPYKIYLYFKT